MGKATIDTYDSHETIRRVARWLDSSRMDHAAPDLTAEDLIEIWRAWSASGVDCYLDGLTLRQQREAARGVIPRWDDDDDIEEGKPEPERKVTIELTGFELELLADALDSHRYWQLAERRYRRDGYVIEPGSDDGETAEEIRACAELEERLRARRCGNGS